MPLPASWVDHLFAKLTVRYGAAFLRQWPADVDVSLVKADWAEVLDGFDGFPDGIAYALRNLDPQRPPNALQFRDLCRQCRSDPPSLSIADDRPSADPQRVREIICRLRSQPIGDVYVGPKAWAHRLRDRELAGEKLTRFQRECWRDALDERHATEASDAP